MVFVGNYNVFNVSSRLLISSFNKISSGVDSLLDLNDDNII